MVRLVEVADVAVDPAAYLVVPSTVDVDSDAVVQQVAAGVKTRLDRVELIETRAAGRVDSGHVQPLARRTADAICTYIRAGRA